MEYDVEKISHKIKNKKMTKKIFKCIIYMLLIFLFVINAILLYQNIFQKDEKNKGLNIYLFNIISRKYAANFRGR